MRAYLTHIVLALGLAPACVGGELSPGAPPLAPGVQSAEVRALPVVPVIEGDLRARVLAVLATPTGLSQRRDMFAKVGDDATESASFLVDLGCEAPPSAARYGAFADLAPVTTYFTTRALSADLTDAWCHRGNAFTRTSLAAGSGATAPWVLGPTPACDAPWGTRLRCEYHLLRPSFALIMLGTEDLLRDADRPLPEALDRYRAAMQSIIDATLADSVVPVLSTVPPLWESASVSQAAVARVARYNEAVADLAAFNTLPLWNLHRALSELGPAHRFGLDADGVHLSVYRGDQGASFDPAALTYGYNVRNLTALRVLAALKAAAVDTARAPAWLDAMLPPATAGLFYSAALSASAAPPPRYRAAGLPPGLEIDAATGLVYGTPAAAGTWSVTFTASNGTAPDATLMLPLAVLAQSAPTITSGPLPNGTAGVPYDFTVVAAASPRATFTAVGLPRGLDLDAVTGHIRGTPVERRAHLVTVTATNGVEPSARRSYTLVTN